MARNARLKTSFNSGELSPRLHARPDLEKTRDGLALCQNCIPVVEGGVTRRPGTRYVATTKDVFEEWEAYAGEPVEQTAGGEAIDLFAKPTRLIPFVFAQTQAYMLELSDLAMRFHMNRGQLIVQSTGLPYEIVTPWVAADLKRLQVAGSADVMWITHPNYVTRQLTRTAHTSWTLSTFEPITGPFLDENTTTTTIYTSVTAAAATGTMTASAALFDALHVGSIWRLDETDSSAYSMWETGKSYSLSDEVRYNDNVYICTTAGTSGTVPPTHLDGQRWDGEQSSSAEWQYIHSGFGVVKITAVTSSTVASITVQSRLPTALGSSAGATEKWREGAWSSYRGFPACVGFYEQRLCFGNTAYEPNRWWTSVAGNFEVMEIGANADDALVVDQLASSVNPIRAIGDGPALTILTAQRIWPWTPSPNGGALAPDDIRRNPTVSDGAAWVQPVTVDDGVIYVSVDGRRVREFTFDRSTGVGSSADLTILAEHVGRIVSA